MGLIAETYKNEQALLQLVMKDGKPLLTPETLTIIRQRTGVSVATLSEETRRLENPISAQVEISNKLQKMIEKTKKQ